MSYLSWIRLLSVQSLTRIYFHFSRSTFLGAIAIALKLSGMFIDPVTLTWFRFLVALIVSFAIQCVTGSIKQFKGLDKPSWLKLTLAGIFLNFNYVSLFIRLSILLGIGAIKLPNSTIFSRFWWHATFQRKAQCIATELFCHFRF